MNKPFHVPAVSRTTSVTALATVILTLACSAFAQSGGSAKVPFDLPKFKEVLSESRLQSPSTSKPEVRDGNFQGFSLPGRFYLADDGSTMVLATTQDGRDRSEIRHNANWTVSGAEKRYTARIRFDEPTPMGKARLHIAQIHIKDFLGNDKGPLLMVTWRENRGGKKGHLWAQVRDDFVPKDKKNTHHDLGPRPDAFTTLDIRIEEGILRIFMNDELRLEKDISYFGEAPLYFKTGCYTRDLKAHSVEFESLTITTP
jgi:hypothetical protein